ncbi:MAG: CotH kinase family protein [Pseudomonadota bacterium]
MPGMLRLTALLLCWGCSHPNVALEPDDPRDSDPAPADSDPPEETAPPEDTSVEQIPGFDPRLLNDWLFQLDQVHEVALTIPAEGIAALGVAPFEYVAADISVDGRAFPQVGVRIKGRLGSLRDLTAKAALKVDFNRYDPAQTLDGLEKLNLNNMVQDTAQVHEVLAYEVYRLAGVPAPRVGYGWVTVNGEVFGLYTLVEAYDDVFLDGWYQESHGNLYDGDYVWYGGSSYTKLDFAGSVQDLFVLDEGEDVGHADIHAVTDALSQGPTGFWDRMSGVLDLDEALAMWAGDTWVGHYDSYSFNQNNFRVYFDPADGRADLFPWDPDWSFYSGTPITTPSGLVSATCRRDTACYNTYLQVLLGLCGTVEASDLQDRLATAAALITPFVEADPRKEHGPAEVAASQRAAQAWIQGRHAELSAALGI